MLKTIHLVTSALALLGSVASTIATADPAALQQQLAAASDQSLLWGPYNPGLYFGLRPRIPDSFRAALLWTSVNDFESFKNGPRYQCRQEDGMKGYGWDEYDIRTGGKQVMHDVGNKVDIETSFVKVEGGENGGNWAVRVKGTIHKDAPKDHMVTVVWHMAHPELEQMVLTTPPEADQTGIKGPVKFKGTLPKLGDFEVEVTEGPKSNRYPSEKESLKDEWKIRPLDRTMYASLGVAVEHYWKAEGYLVNSVQRHIQKMQGRITDKTDAERPRPWQLFLLDNAYVNGNMHYVQKIFKGDFEFDILYSSGSAPEKITSDVLTTKIKENHEKFEERFSKVFKRSAPFTDAKYDEFSKALFSNLLGGIGYFYGDQIIDRSDADAYAEEDENFWEAINQARETAGEEGRTHEGPSELFTSIPSRPFFPRGFLWDEGYHLLPIADWDMDVALQIIQSWFNQMDSDGWIAREQILGEEARSRVPLEFQVQHPTHANPPTLTMVLDKLLDKLEQQASNSDPDLTNLPQAHLHNPTLAIQFLKNLYPLLKKNHAWYRSTQTGEITAYDRDAHSRTAAFRWRGRTPNHCLASGLDDYPRPQPPHPGELHVDLISWMAAYTRSLKRIAHFINNTADATTYLNLEMRITKNIEALHWNPTHKAFCDVTFNDETAESEHVCHRGYINLFPLLLETIDPYSEKLGLTMQLMEDSEELWTQYGLRSLSKSDPEYLSGENYWRGPIWININYLAINALRKYAGKEGPYRERAASLYERLRSAVVENVWRQWRETGYAWEQYDPATGKGQRTAHFTGWTSLVVEIMSMPESLVMKEGLVVDAAEDVKEEVVATPEGHDEL